MKIEGDPLQGEGAGAVSNQQPLLVFVLVRLRNPSRCMCTRRGERRQQRTTVTCRVGAVVQGRIWHADVDGADGL